MVTVDILVLFLTLGEKLSVFHSLIWWWLWGFHIWPLKCCSMCAFYSYFVEGSYQEWILNFVPLSHWQEVLSCCEHWPGVAQCALKDLKPTEAVGQLGYLDSAPVYIIKVEEECRLWHLPISQPREFQQLWLVLLFPIALTRSWLFFFLCARGQTNLLTISCSIPLHCTLQWPRWGFPLLWCLCFSCHSLCGVSFVIQSGLSSSGVIALKIGVDLVCS